MFLNSGKIWLWKLTRYPQYLAKVSCPYYPKVCVVHRRLFLNWSFEEVRKEVCVDFRVCVWFIGDGLNRMRKCVHTHVVCALQIEDAPNRSQSDSHPPFLHKCPLRAGLLGGISKFYTVQNPINAVFRAHVPYRYSEIKRVVTPQDPGRISGG